VNTTKGQTEGLGLKNLVESGLGGGPVVRQQFIEPVDRMFPDSGEHIPKPYSRKRF